MSGIIEFYLGCRKYYYHYFLHRCARRCAGPFTTRCKRSRTVRVGRMKAPIESFEATIRIYPVIKERRPFTGLRTLEASSTISTSNYLTRLYSSSWLESIS